MEHSGRHKAWRCSRRNSGWRCIARAAPFSWPGQPRSAQAWRIPREIDTATATGPLPHYYLGLAGDVLLAAGRAAHGLAYLDRAIATVDEPGVGFFLPEIYRLRGECRLALCRGNEDEARRDFATAREIATRQGAMIFERRASASLAEVSSGPTTG